MDRPFDSAWLKWGRGVVHAHALEQEITRYIANPTGHEFTADWTHYDPKRHGFPVTITSYTEWPTHWGVLLGDVIANYRSALDHIAWAIVGRGKRGANLTEKEARDVYFPVVSTDRLDFKREAATKLIGAKRADIAIVRKAQPYTLGRRAKRHVIYVLNELSKADKHRTVQPVQTITVGGEYTLLSMVDCKRSADTRQPRQSRAVMEVGAELGLVRVRKTGPNPTIDMDIRLDLSPGITATNQLRDWFHVTGQLIRNLLFFLGNSEAPDEIAQLGDPQLFFAPGQVPPHLRP